MEMHQIRYFLAVARVLNFTRAAEESNVTQPSLTRAIQKLEEEFGGLLFRRERSLTHLTDLGRMMLPHLEKTYEAAQAAKMLARGVGKATVASLTMGLAAELDELHLNAALADVGQALPGFQLRLIHGDDEMLVQDMLKGDLDLAIIPAPRILHDRIDAVSLFEQIYGLALPADHPLASRDAELQLADLDNMGLVERPGDVAQELRERCAAQGIAPDYRHRASSAADVVRLVSAKLGCGLVDSVAPATPGIVHRAFADCTLARTIVVASVSGRKRAPAADAMLRALRARPWKNA